MRTITALVFLVLLLLNVDARAETLEFGGRSRTFTVFVPPGVAASGKPAPVVIALHGGMGSGVQMQGWLGMDAVATRSGFIVVYPDGIERNWNDGRAAIFIRSAGPPPDDVGFLVQLARALTERGLADGRRIYVTGASNGGMMSYRLACETRGVFAGYAAMIANVSVELARTCAPPAAVHMLIMNGTDDPLMPYGGGSVARNTRGEVTSTADTFARWRTASGCHGVAPPEQLPDRVSSDGSRVEVFRGLQCASGADVVLYSVVGGGHTMPSPTRASRPLLDSFLGRTNRDIDAAETVWAFFSRR